MHLVTPKDGWGPFKPRRWQGLWYPKFIQHYSKTGAESSVSVACTGSGKSIAIAQAVASIHLEQNESIVISTTTIPLVEQISETMRARLDPPGFALGQSKVGCYYTHGKDVVKPVIVTCSPSLAELAKAMEKAGRKCVFAVLDECVVSGTMIHTPTGSVPIESLNVGDEVLGFNHSTQKVVTNKVLHTFKRETSALLYKIRGTVMTGNHPVCTNRGALMSPQYALAKYVGIGSRLYELNGVGGIEQRDGAAFIVPREEPTAEVFNIETETGNYFANGLLVHNCHRSEAKTIHKGVELLKTPMLYGWTATPFRSKEDERLSLFENKEVLSSYGLLEGVNDGIIVPWRFVPWTGGESELDPAAIEMTSLARGPGLYNAVSIADAELFCRKLKEIANVDSMTVHSKLPRGEIKTRLEMLKAGKLHSLVHVSMMQEGIDLPWLRWMCLRRPVNSRVRFVQELGRSIRAWLDPDGVPYKDERGRVIKDETYLYDPHGLGEAFRLQYKAVLGGESSLDLDDAPEDESQLKESEKKEHQFKQMIFDVMQEIVNAKAGKKPLSTTPLAGYLRELVSIFDLSGLLGEKISDMSWRSRPSSQPQINSAGWYRKQIEKSCVPRVHKRPLNMIIDHVPALTRGAASDLISVLESIQKNSKWPNLSVLDRSAVEAMAAVEKKKNVSVFIPRPSNPYGQKWPGGPPNSAPVKSKASKKKDKGPSLFE